MMCILPIGFVVFATLCVADAAFCVPTFNKFVFHCLPPPQILLISPISTAAPWWTIASTT